MAADESNTSGLAGEPAFRLGDLEVRPSTREVVGPDGREVLEPRVMQVLVALARRRGHVVARAELIAECWDGRTVGEDAINRCIQALRRLAAAHGGFKLTTIARIGHRLDEIGIPAPSSVTLESAAPGAKPRWRRGALIAGAVLVLALAILAAFAWTTGRFSHPPGFTLQIVRFEPLDGPVPSTLPQRVSDQLRAAFESDKFIRPVKGRADFRLKGGISRNGDRLHYTLSLEDRSGEPLRSWSEDTSIDPMRSATQISSRASEFVRCGLIALGEHNGPLSRHARSLSFELCAGGAARRRIDIAQTLIREAPTFAAGWSQLAYAYGSATFAAAPQDAPALRAKALAAADRALALNPHSSSAYRVMSWMQPPGTPYAHVELLLKKAISTQNTDCGCEHRDYGDFLMDVGRTAEAVGEYQRSIDINAGGSEYLSLAHAWYFAGQPARAREVLDGVAAAWGDEAWSGFVALDDATSRRDWSQVARLTAADAQTDAERGIAEAFAAVATKDRTGMAAVLPLIRRLAMLPSLDRWKARPPMLDERPALLLLLMDRPQEALDAIARLMGRYGPDGGQLLFNPMSASLRTDPAYARLLETSGLMRYWRASKTRPDFCDGADAPAFCTQLR